MTEVEWLSCTDPRPMLTFLTPSRISHRKLLLFGLGCSYRQLHLVTDERIRLAFEVASRYADGKATPNEVDTAHQAACEAATDCADETVGPLTDFANWTVAYATSSEATFFIEQYFSSTPDAHQKEQEREEASVLRDIIGNFFRRAVMKPVWLSSTVKQVAEAIYNERAFDRISILADALEDAGCTSPDILNHCRQAGEHVRGCWVVDLVLGKE
jgi:hypothetical protein